MDIAHFSPERSQGERIARMAVVAFLALALLTLVFGLGWAAKDASTGSSSASANGPIDGKLLDEIYSILKNNYVDKSQLTPDKIQAAAIQGIISSLHDPHTSYLTQADLKSGELDLNSTYEGIGASIAQQDSNVVIVATFRGSPAEKAGIKAGDVILGVDGQSAAGWSDQQVVNHVRGKSGTTVSIKVRHSDGKEETISVTRAEIPRQSVFTDPQTPILTGSGTKLVDASGNPVPGIAYINISQFHDKTYDELVNVLKEPQYKDAKGLLLDMRGNPGGLLDAVVNIADEFLEKGTILTEKDADGGQHSWTAKPGGLATKVPVVILLDKSSASGAEVLAGALRDNGRAKIVGMPSFGKGTVNQLMPLHDCGDPQGCGAVYVSVGRWYTPNGTQIEGVGLKPDYQVDLTQDIYDKQGDVQMLKAIDVLQQEIGAVH